MGSESARKASQPPLIETSWPLISIENELVTNQHRNELATNQHRRESAFAIVLICDSTGRECEGALGGGPLERNVC